MSIQVSHPHKALHTAIGLMSGTSKDGVDVVRLTTDGEGHITDVRHFARGYPRELYARLVALAKGDVPLNEVLRVEQAVTFEYIEALAESGFVDAGVDVIGCHGQTVRHLPDEGLTWQLGDASLLAEGVLERTGFSVPVVMDFRRRDMAAGGQGAPLVPLFHRAMVPASTGVCAVLNIGGVANISLLENDTVSASDCGPGMGLLDQFVQARTGAPYDVDGALAQAGPADMAVVERAFAEIPFFARGFPKSADRYEFNDVLEWLQGHSDADGAATLAALTVAGIVRSAEKPGSSGMPLGAVYLAGGGPRNAAIVQGLEKSGLPVKRVEDLGWPSLAVEGGCFAWLAVRRLKGLPFSTPATTGARRPTVGGLVTV